MQAASCVAPGNRLRGSSAKRDAATVNLLTPRFGDLEIRASLVLSDRNNPDFFLGVTVPAQALPQLFARNQNVRTL
jgi:hypothetical protein